MKKLVLNKTHVMGVLNVTPDSFSDGGRFVSRDSVIQQAAEMLKDGATIIDVGGESTRPGASPVSLDEELARVVPVVEMLVDEFDVFVSVDTSKPEVMQAAASSGASMINDVLALRHKEAVDVAAKSGLPVCLMHMRGTPETMQTNPQYEDVIEDIIGFLRNRISACIAAGIGLDRIVVDPGFGFGKSLAHNFQILRGLKKLLTLGCPVLVGMSRKSMIGKLLDLPVKERDTASAILAALALERGANILRVHDVKGTMQALKLVEAMNTMR